MRACASAAIVAIASLLRSPHVQGHGPIRTPVSHGRAVVVSAPRLILSAVEFIALIALMMALTAMSIDLMLPALPAIGAALGVSDPNARQIVIISYVAGFALGQLGHGRLLVFMGALFFLFGLVAPNFNALAMEPQGHNAGLASAKLKIDF